MKSFLRMRLAAAAVAALLFTGNINVSAQATGSSATPSVAHVTASGPNASSQIPDGKKTEFMSVDLIRAGMKGVAYTVFEGVKPEPMDVEILGVLPNMAGPRSHVILARLKGEKAEYTGVVAGMSGSPVYIDGKLVGALAYRIGTFSKEPIAGITPIEYMMEIQELDASIPQQTPNAYAHATGATKTGLAVSEPLPSPVQQYASVLTPITAPLAFSGFSEETLQLFGGQFASAGMAPVLGAGAVTEEKQPEAIEPGSSVGAVLVRGDMSIAATCTVTYASADRLLACGHPLMQLGMVNMPMSKSRVLATLPSPLNAFKIAAATEPVGSFVQDRHTGILGRFGEQPQMIPVNLTVRGGTKLRRFHFEVLNSPRITPVAVMATVFNALQASNESGDEVSYRLQGRINVNGFPAVEMQDMFTNAESSQPTAMGVATSLGSRFTSIFENSFQKPAISGVDMEVDLVRERRLARLENARTSVVEARPGDEIVIEAVMRPYRGEPFVRQVPIRIPTSAPRGTLRILVGDGDTLDRMRRTTPASMRRADLAATIGLLNRERANHKLYVALLEPNPQAMIGEKVMPALPLSVMNVMENMRGTQEMIVTGESAVSEASTPIDYVVTGAQVITINVK